MESKKPTISVKHAFFFIIFQIIFSCFFFAYIHTTRNSSKVLCLSQEDNLPTNEKEKEEQELLILLWTWPFGQPFALDKCPEIHISGCYFTVDRNLYSVANAVVLHHRDVCNHRNQLPQVPRPHKQRWIWFDLESPAHSPNLGFMDNLINLTISYRRDSDIFSPYGWLEILDELQNFSIPAKSKLAAWVVSNWNPGSRRVKYYLELQKYLKVDIYGSSHMKLPQNKLTTTISQYKFYFAFENSVHEDYITEKLWRNALGSGAVPVVLGPPRENYERFIPRDAFIHVDDFPNPQELAAYLHMLDADEQRYQHYFDWRMKFRPVEASGWISHYCKACQALRNAPTYRSWSSLVPWYK